MVFVLHFIQLDFESFLGAASLSLITKSGKGNKKWSTSLSSEEKGTNLYHRWRALVDGEEDADLHAIKQDLG